MGWIGQRGADGGQFSGESDASDAVMPCGTVLIEYRHLVCDHPVNLLRYMARDPHPAALTLRCDPDGALRVLVRCGAEDAGFEMAMPALLPDETVVLRYGWDVDRGQGILSATVAERDIHLVVELPLIVPLTVGVARQMMLGPECHMTGQVTYLAVSDEMEPVGPMPGLDGAARVMTPRGAVALRDVTAGDIVQASDGEAAQVRWVGRATLPARGLYRPVQMRAPYYGVRQDLLLKGGQMLHLLGTEVEYLFAESEVAVAARDLVDERAVMAGPQGGYVTYFHVMIDRAVPLMVEGMVVPGFDPGAMIESQVLARHSVLAGYPAELLPREAGVRRPALQGFEAETLRRMRVA